MVLAIDEDGQWLLQNMYITTKTGRRKSTASEVQQRLAEVTSITHRLNELLNGRRNEINAVLADTLSFEESATQFEKWLIPVEKKLATQKPLVLNPKELTDEVLKHEVQFMFILGFKTSKQTLHEI